MIVVPKDPQELGAMFEFAHAHAGVSPTPDTHVIGWAVDGQLKIVVALNAWLGKTCQMHIAFEPGFHFTPRAMLKACFRHAFERCNREMVLGVVNSHNDQAMRYDLHLGFEEVGRIRAMHDEGGDIVVLAMKREDCRYLTDRVNGEEHGGIAGHA